MEYLDAIRKVETTPKPVTEPKTGFLCHAMGLEGDLEGKETRGDNEPQATGMDMHLLPPSQHYTVVAGEQVLQW